MGRYVAAYGEYLLTAVNQVKAQAIDRRGLAAG